VSHKLVKIKCQQNTVNTTCCITAKALSYSSCFHAAAKSRIDKVEEELRLLSFCVVFNMF